MPHGKQAKMLTPKQETAVLTYLRTLRYPVRDRVMFLLSIKAGLRAKEIACLTWSMVTDADGQVAEMLALPNRASKGRGGGRMIPLNLTLRAALALRCRGLPEACRGVLRAGGATDRVLRHQVVLSSLP
jgi:integrase